LEGVEGDRLDGVGRRQCDQIWRNFDILANKIKSLGNFVNVYLVFGKILNPLWRIFYAIGQIFIVVNGQTLLNNLAIWSHCI